ncbi:hypothetical protein EXIGLDRAFT_839311 [Exidia glandulosa HHB12029]|uniref:Gti1/Pac2 family-domain-containing protein n=1 Tax=Exidia glandulosa HHB12029 TaxID=1314781 RepID=A0A165F4E0_EXIGL|nr:hypothetical protein EXIGLDRAFT_839311 [Exidia glandulosa HHB12029]
METEYRAYIQDTGDALLAFEAALSGSAWIPRVTRRWNHYERARRIRSGTVFVINERESNVKRWTDGRMWTPSRILKNFLVYRERFSHDEVSTNSDEGMRYPVWLVGACDGPEVRKDGLIKKTISIVVQGTRYSLVSYYHPKDVLNRSLLRPCDFAPLSSQRIRSSILACKGMREKVRIVTGADGVRRPIFEANEVNGAGDPCHFSFDDNDDSDAGAWALPPPATTPSPMLEECVPVAAPRLRSASDSLGSPAFKRAAHSRSPMNLRQPRPRVRFEPYGRPDETQSLPPSPTYASPPTYHAPTPLTRSFSEPSFLTLHNQPEPEFTFIKEEPAFDEAKPEQVFLSDSMSAITPEMPRLAPRTSYSPHSHSDGPVTPPALETQLSFEYLPSHGCWLSPAVESLKQVDTFAQFSNYTYTLEPALTFPAWNTGDLIYEAFFAAGQLA